MAKGGLSNTHFREVGATALATRDEAGVEAAAVAATAVERVEEARRKTALEGETHDATVLGRPASHVR